MFRELEEDAIYICLDLHFFWNLTLKQFNKYCAAFNRKEKDRLKEKDTLNYMLGKYISWAFNDPKNYPKNPFLEKVESKKSVMNEDEMEEVIKRNTLMMGGTIKK